MEQSGSCGRCLWSLPLCIWSAAIILIQATQLVRYIVLKFTPNVKYSPLLPQFDIIICLCKILQGENIALNLRYARTWRNLNLVFLVFDFIWMAATSFVLYRLILFYVVGLLVHALMIFTVCKFIEELESAPTYSSCMVSI